jgi:hypothetical protein
MVAERLAHDVRRGRREVGQGEAVERAALAPTLRTRPARVRQPAAARCCAQGARAQR